MNGFTKVMYMLIALLASILLWIYVMGVERPEKEEVFSVPVTFAGEQELHEDYSLVVTGGKRQTVSLTVRGTYMDIAALNSGKEVIRVNANLVNFSTPGRKVLTYDVVLPSGSDITIIGQSPLYVEVTLEKIHTRAVDVVFKNEGTLEKDFLQKPPEINPASLQITGPQNVVEEISYAEVVWTRQNVNQTLTLDLDYKLYNADGGEVQSESITANTEFVSVTLPVQKTKEIPLTVEVLPGGGATEGDIDKVVSPSSITVAGDPTVIDGINFIQLGVVRLAEVFGSGGSRVYPVLLPEGVENLSGVTESEVTITIRDLKTTALTCENISYINPPEGVNIDVITSQIAITIRGKEEDVAAIAANNLRVVVNLEGVDVTAGRKSIPGTVYIDGANSVGAVGVYMIALEFS